MTEERSIPDCIEVIQGVLEDLRADTELSSHPDIPHLHDALQCLKAIEKHYYDRDKFLEKIRLYLMEQEKFVAKLMKDSGLY